MVHGRIGFEPVRGADVTAPGGATIEATNGAKHGQHSGRDRVRDTARATHTTPSSGLNETLCPGGHFEKREKSCACI